MKSMTSILAIGAAAIGVFSSTAAHARFKTDSLTGPDSGDTTMIRSALTTTPSDTRASATNPYVSSNTSDWYGNDRFGAGFNVYSYTGTSSDGWAGAYNYLTVNARALYDYKTPVQAYLSANTHWPTVSSNVYATIYSMGNLVRNKTRGGAQFNSLYYLNVLTQDFWTSPKVSFDVYGVTVFVQAKVYGHATQSVNGRVWAEGINGTLSQGAGVRAEVVGGAEVLWGAASGGVAVKDLSLTTLSFPLVATANHWGFSPAPGACVNITSVGARYSTSLQWLSGRVVLWGKLFWGAVKDEYEIANWPGITKSWDIINYPAQSKQLGNTCFPNAGTPPTT